MARPKEKTSTAFQQKCLAASEKLASYQANKLKDDIERLYTDEELSDFSVGLGSRKCFLHACILNARCTDLYEYITSDSRLGNNGVTMVTNSHSTDIEQCLRLLYTENDVTETLAHLHEYLSPEVDKELEQLDTNIPSISEQDKMNDVHRSHETDTSIAQFEGSKEIINHGNLGKDNTATVGEREDGRYIFDERIKNRSAEGECEQESSFAHNTAQFDSSSNCDNSNRDSSQSVETAEGCIHKLAERIVEKVIVDALRIVGCLTDDADFEYKTRVYDEACESNNMVVINAETCAMHLNKVSNNLKSGSQNCVKSTSCQEKSVTKTETYPKNNCRFKTNCFKKSSGNIQRLIEQVYGVKTLMKPCSQLGEDLLRMLLEQHGCDCVIEVGGQRYPAHRCILAARSSYFAAMLGGSWRESGEESIVLTGIEPCIMKQTLLYLYGGVVQVDPACTIAGLIMVADMYGMEGLKDIVAFNLNMTYCHFFHRPCTECISGVPEVLTLTMMYNMDSMKEKCVRWINKNFDKVWATKSLATLPQEVLEVCASSAVNDLAISNVLDTMIDCQRLNEKTPRLRWTEPVFDMITRLMDAAIEFASQNFINLISGNTFRKIDKEGISFNRQPLEDIFGMIIQALSPENACLAYLSLNKWVKTIEARPEEELPLFSEDFEDFVNILFKKCMEHLCLYVHQAANTVEWELLSKDMQKSIMEDANYVCIDTNRGRMARPKLTSMQKKISATSPLSLKEYFDCHFGHSKPPARTSVKSTKDQLKSEPKKGTSHIPLRHSSRERKGKPPLKASTSRSAATEKCKPRTIKQVTKASVKTAEKPSSTKDCRSKPGVAGKVVSNEDSRLLGMSKVAAMDKKHDVTKGNHKYGIASRGKAGIQANVNGTRLCGVNALADRHSHNIIDEPKTCCVANDMCMNLEDHQYVDLAEGLIFNVEKPLPVFDVDFLMPN